MAQQQRAAEQRKRHYSDERKRAQDYKYQIHQQADAFVFRLIAFLFSPVGLITRQPLGVRVKPLLCFYDSGDTGTLLGLPQTHSWLCSGGWKQARWPARPADAGERQQRCEFSSPQWVFSRRYSIKLSMAFRGPLVHALRREWVKRRITCNNPAVARKTIMSGCLKSCAEMFIYSGSPTAHGHLSVFQANSYCAKKHKTDFIFRRWW